MRPNWGVEGARKRGWRIFYQRFRTVEVYLFINWKEIELPSPFLSLSLSPSSFFFFFFSLPFLFFFFSAMEASKRGLAEKGAERWCVCEKEREREREGERIRRSCGRKKRIEIAQDFRTEMEIRYRNRDFHHREPLSVYGAWNNVSTERWIAEE